MIRESQTASPVLLQVISVILTFFDITCISHNLRSTKIDEDDVGEDTGGNEENNEDTSSVVEEMSTGVSETRAAVDDVPMTDAVIPVVCEVCLIRQRSRQAFVPCGHSRLCESCVNEIIHSGSGCPICRAAIVMTINIY